MGSVRLLDRVEGVVAEVLEARVPEADDLEWAVALVPTVTGCEEHQEVSLALGLHASLMCPETGKRVVATVVIPLRDCDDEDLAESVHDIWEHMTISRMEQAVGS